MLSLVICAVIIEGIALRLIFLPVPHVGTSKIEVKESEVKEQLWFIHWSDRGMVGNALSS